MGRPSGVVRGVALELRTNWICSELTAERSGTDVRAIQVSLA